MWQKLRHPNVIKMYGACDAGPHLQFFVCEYASNGSLIEHVTSASVEKKTMWKFLYEAALSLEYLHERGIVHGDLRCSNILIGDDGLSKLSNFGLSGSTSLASSSVGSMRWQSPEVLAGNPSSFASDVYSLGMCVLEAATGKAPWEHKGDDQVRIYKAEWTPEARSTFGWCSGDPVDTERGLSRPFRYTHDLVWRMCCQDPGKRVSLSSVVHELERLAIEESSNVPQPEYEPATSFDDFNGGKARDVWKDLQEFVKKSENDQYRQAFNELEKVHDRLCSGKHPSRLLSQLHTLLTEFQAVVSMTADQALAMRLSSTSATSNSFHAFHRRIQSTWAALGESVDLAQEREAQWEKQRSELFVSGVSDIYLLLSERGSVEEKATFLQQLQVEIDTSTSKYTPDQVQVMKKALETISSKVEAESLTDLVPDWFIPWFELIVDEWRCLGVGGFGSVYLAKWLDSEVVVEQVILANTGDGADARVPTALESWLTSEVQSTTPNPTDPKKRAEALAMFRREVDIWFGFSHPHVIRLFGACHIGRPFFVCEYATNGTLINYLKDHPDQLWPKLLEAALGVQYLHARGVVHGDLKGNNIVIGSDFKAKVTDFGLSSLKSDGSKVVISAASHWVAPECFSGAIPEPTFASDVYSLGMCIVEALRVVEGGDFCLPWGSLDNAAVRGNAKMAKLPSRPGICEDSQWELVKRMCAFEPEQRIKISTVVDELAELSSETKDSVTNENTVPVNLESVPNMVLLARESLSELGDSRSELPVYTELWDRLEKIHGLIDGKHGGGKCCAAFCSLVGDASMSTKKLPDTNGSLMFLAETTMRGYELHRRLDKFVEAFSDGLSVETTDGEVPTEKSATNAQGLPGSSSS